MQANIDEQSEMLGDIGMRVSELSFTLNQFITLLKIHSI